MRIVFIFAMNWIFGSFIFRGNVSCLINFGLLSLHCALLSNHFRSWATREYVRQVGLVVIDEIHLLGVERGHVLEAIVTR